MKFVQNAAKKLRRRLERQTTAVLFSAVQLASPHGSVTAPGLSSYRNCGRVFSEIVCELAKKLLTVLKHCPSGGGVNSCLPAFDLGVPNAAGQVKSSLLWEALEG